MHFIVDDIVFSKFLSLSPSLSPLSVDGKYVPQGKLGCAVLGLHSTKDVTWFYREVM